MEYFRAVSVLSICVFFTVRCQDPNAPAVENENIVTAHLFTKLGVLSIGNVTFNASDPRLQDVTSSVYITTATAVCDVMKTIFKSTQAKQSLPSIIYQGCSALKFTNATENTEFRLEFSNGTVDIAAARNLLSVTSLQSHAMNVISVSVADVDECNEMSVCSSFATCENYEGGFKCTCRPGYEDVAKTSFQNQIGGRYCSQPCASNSCSGHGTCRVRFNGPIFCQCDADYAGVDCSESTAPTTPSPGQLEDWSIIVIAISMGALAIFLIVVIPFIIYRARQYKKLEEEEEIWENRSFGTRGTLSSRRAPTSFYDTVSHSSSIAAYQARLPSPSGLGEFSIPRPLVIDPKTFSLHNPYNRNQTNA